MHAITCESYRELISRVKLLSATQFPARIADDIAGMVGSVARALDLGDRSLLLAIHVAERDLAWEQAIRKAKDLSIDNRIPAR